MRTDFTVTVKLDASPLLVSIVEAITGKRLEETGQPGQAEESKQPEQTGQAGQPEQDEQDGQAEQPQAAKFPSMEDVRAAMHRTRLRIEGGDYKDNPDSEGYKKYHKALTAAFKNIASALGSDKPSSLPAEYRQNFIYKCDELEATPEGTIQDKVPF